MSYDLSTSIRLPEKIIGFTCSAFDLLHAGHVAMLEDISQQCDYLIVGLQSDPTIDRPEKNKPVESVLERTIKLRALCYVDEIIVYNTEKELETLFELVKMHVRFLGEEYIGKNFTGKDTCLRRGIEIRFNDRKHSLSSSGLRNRIVS